MPVRYNPFTGELDLIGSDGSVGSLQVDTDSGTATPSGDTIQILGSGTVATSAAGNAITITGTDPNQDYVTDSGTATSSGASVSILGATGISTSGSGSTVTVTGSETTFNSDSGSAVSSGNAVTMTGGTGIDTSAAGSTVTFAVADAVPLSIVTDSGTATPASNSFSIVGAGGASTSASGSTVTVTASGGGGGTTWSEITTATKTMVVAEGYVSNRAGGVTYTLPATATLGDEMYVVGKAGTWVIAQNASQQILVGSGATTVGAGGSVTSTDAGDTIHLVCTTGGASTVWRAISAVGNLTLA